MGIYNTFRYNTDDYGYTYKYNELSRLRYGVCIVGIEIRGHIGKKYIYRVRRGNGYYGSSLRRRYQDKYVYFIPTSINNTQGQHARDVLAAAVSAWQGLSEAEKESWRAKEHRNKNVPGYNLFIRQYFKDNY